MSDILVVGIADAKIATNQETLVSYALGSCVGVCLYDTKTHIAGMVHILLPYKGASLNPHNEFKFADSGICKLLEIMLLKGAQKHHIIAKIAGGAEMFKMQSDQEGVGKRNIKAVREVLRHLRVPLIGEDIGNTFGRSIWFDPINGSLKIKTVNHGIQII